MAARPIAPHEDLRPEDLDRVRDALRSQRAMSTSSLTEAIEDRAAKLGKYITPAPPIADNAAAANAKTSTEIDAMTGPARDPSTGRFQNTAEESAAQPGASDQAEPLSQGQDASGPSTYRVNVDGVDMDLTASQVAEYVKQARTQEQAAEAAELMFNKAAADHMFSQWVESDNVPDDVKDFVMEVIRTKQIPSLPQARKDEDDTMTEDPEERPQTRPAQADPGTRAEIARLNAHLKELLVEKQAREAAEAERTMEQQVDDLMSQRDIFKDKAIAGLARQAIVNTVKANPRAKLGDVVAQIAATSSNLKRGTSKAEGAEQAPAASQSKSGTTTKPLAGADLKNGNVLDRVLGRLNARR